MNVTVEEKVLVAGCVEDGNGVGVSVAVSVLAGVRVKVGEKVIV